jgi:threonine/homoserine/homoserine lactone efflux protein
MIEPHTLLLFFSASVVLALTPRPDNLFVMAQSAQNGRAAGMFVTLGLCTGLVGHTLAVAFGLAAVVHGSALAFTVLKTAGAVYLIYLAWQALRAGSGGEGDTNIQPLSAGALYRRGIVMNLTNPKVSLLFFRSSPIRHAVPWYCSSFSSAVFSSWQLFSYSG